MIDRQKRLEQFDDFLAGAMTILLAGVLVAFTQVRDSTELSAPSASTAVNTVSLVSLQPLRQVP
jgi:hypothetical protein